MKSIPFFFMLLIGLFFMGLAQAHDGCDAGAELTPNYIRMHHPRAYESHEKTIKGFYKQVEELLDKVRFYPLPSQGYSDQYERAVENYRDYLASIGVLRRDEV